MLESSSHWCGEQLPELAHQVFSFLSRPRLLLLEEPGKRFLVCAGSLLHPGGTWQRPGDHADPYTGKLQGGQTLRVPVRWSPFEWEETDPMCGVHAHQRAPLPQVTVPPSWEARDHLMSQVVIVLLLISLSLFWCSCNTQKCYKLLISGKFIDSTGKKLSGAYDLWTFQSLFTMLFIWWLCNFLLTLVFVRIFFILLTAP